METKKHYEDHLASYYSWMCSGFENNSNKNKQFFINNNIIPRQSKVAIDLGAGSGFQSIPLAEIGFTVYAVDFSSTLLKELKSNAKSGDIIIIEDDILHFTGYSGKNPELIICMGDTLTHVDNIGSVTLLIQNAYDQLQKNGTIILTFRDLTFELKDEHRFIPVRNSDDVLFTCFLEYHIDYLTVYDIINQKVNGKWEQKISSYKKTRISQHDIKQTLSHAGFHIELFEVNNGMITIIGKKYTE